MAEAAVSVLRTRGWSDRVGIVSTYMTHIVYRGILRGRIPAAPIDFPVLQGRLETFDAGPAIITVTPDNIAGLGAAESLASAFFAPVFAFEAQRD